MKPIRPAYLLALVLIPLMGAVTYTYRRSSIETVATKNIEIENVARTGIVTFNNQSGASSRTIDVSDLVVTDDVITELGDAIVLGSGETIRNSTDGQLEFIADDDAVDLLILDWKSSIAGTANGDKITHKFTAKDSGGTSTVMATARMEIVDVTDTSEDAALIFQTVTAGTLADELALIGGNFYPTTDDGLDLGATATRWNKAWFNAVDADGLLTFSTAIMQGATIFIAEGATADAHEKSFAVTDPTSDTTTTFPDYTGTVIQTGRVSQVYMFTDFVAGAGAGWIVTGANNGRATLPAGVSAGTLVVRLTGLHTGDIITAFTLAGQVESAGNTATLDATLYKNVSAAADITQTDIGAITQVSVTADAIVSASKTLDTPETIAADESFYVLITGTTAASTDFDLQGVKLTLTKN